MRLQSAHQGMYWTEPGMVQWRDFVKIAKIQFGPTKEQEFLTS